MVRTLKIKAWMIKRGWTQYSVADAAGVSQTMVSMFVRGDRRSERLTRFFLDNGCPSAYLGGQGKEAA